MAYHYHYRCLHYFQGALRYLDLDLGLLDLGLLDLGLGLDPDLERQPKIKPSSEVSDEIPAAKEH
jgi:hypothetical protein